MHLIFFYLHIYYKNEIYNLAFALYIFSQIREGRKQTLPECLKKEFRLTINALRSKISGDVYEVLNSPFIIFLPNYSNVRLLNVLLQFQGIRALAIDKDNAPKVTIFILRMNQCEVVSLSIISYF